MSDPSTTPVTSASPASYSDEDIVYVDPDSRTVIGALEWTGETPVSKVYVPTKKDPAAVKKPSDDRPFFRKFFPVGTYRTMKRVFKIEGKVKDAEPNKTLEEVLPRALSEAFWTWEDKKKVEQDSMSTASV
jgi:hypothetical protein